MPPLHSSRWVIRWTFSRLRSSAWNVTRDERRNKKRDRRTFSHNLRGDKTPISIRSISISISGPRVSAPATLCHPVSKYRWLGTYLALWWDDGTTCLGRKLLKTHTMRRSAVCCYWSYTPFNFVMYPVSSTQLIILHFVVQWNEASTIQDWGEKLMNIPKITFTQ